MEDNIISKWIFKYGNEIVRKNTEEKLEKIMENKETIEEVAERLFKEYSNYTSLAEGHYEYMIDKEDFKEASLEIAEWQQEHYGLMEIELRHTKTLLASCEKALEERDKQQKERYSEEEVRNIANWAFGFYRRNDLDDDELGDEFNRVLIEIFKTK